MHGLASDAACPECGSDRREVDLHAAHRRSNLGNACAFTACGFLVYAVAAPLAAANIPQGPAFYSVNTWWLLLGWLAGAVFHIVALQCYRPALTRPLTASVKLWFVAAYAVWLLAVVSVLMLFQSAGQKGVVFPFGRERTTLDLGLKLSLAIPIATALMPSILAYHFQKRTHPRIAKGLAAAATGIMLSAGLVVVLYLLAWLDWTVGIDLYLSDSQNRARIVTGLDVLLLLSAGFSIATVVICVAAFKANRLTPKYQPDDAPDLWPAS